MSPERRFLTLAAFMILGVAPVTGAEPVLDPKDYEAWLNFEREKIAVEIKKDMPGAFPYGLPRAYTDGLAQFGGREVDVAALRSACKLRPNTLFGCDSMLRAESSEWLVTRAAKGVETAEKGTPERALAEAELKVQQKRRAFAVAELAALREAEVAKPHPAQRYRGALEVAIAGVLRSSAERDSDKIIAEVIEEAAAVLAGGNTPQEIRARFPDEKAAFIAVVDSVEAEFGSRSWGERLEELFAAERAAHD